MATISMSQMKKREEFTAWLFILPNTLGFIVFSLLPILIALILSFCNWDLLSPVTWRGLENYRGIFQDPTFYKALSNNLIYTAIEVPVCLAVALLLAVTLNKKIIGKTIYRTIYFLPYVTTITAVAAVWIWIYHPRGFINNILMMFGVANPPIWLLNANTVIPAIAIIAAWRGLGFPMLIFLAGLQGISKDLYEAADIDGASEWKKFWNVTFPMLSPTTFFLVVTGIIGSFKAFDIIYAVTNGGPGKASYVMVYYIYESAFKDFKMGYASALSYVLLAVILVITLIQWRGQQKWVNE